MGLGHPLLFYLPDASMAVLEGGSGFYVGEMPREGSGTHFWRRESGAAGVREGMVRVGARPADDNEDERETLMEQTRWDICGKGVSIFLYWQE